MMETDHSDAIRHLTYEDKEVLLIGTAHVSKESVDLVKSVIESEAPDTVCVELCEGRFQTMRRQDHWQNMDIIKVIKEKKVFLLLSNLILAAFQKRMAAKLEIRPGQEMIQAVTSAESVSAEICLADRDVRVTLARTWRQMGLWSRIKLFFQLVLSLGGVDEISAEELENREKKEQLELELKQFIDLLPENDKKMLELKYFHKFSVKDLQKEFNLSASAVKMRLFRARQRIEQILEVRAAA